MLSYFLWLKNLSKNNKLGFIMLHKQLWVSAREFTLNQYEWALIKCYRHFVDIINTNLLYRLTSMQ